MSTEDLETTRGRYRPSAVQVLLVGESPPLGRGFFYTGDSSLFKFTVPVVVEQCGFTAEPTGFLMQFAEAGFFLDDFSTKRGDKPAARAGDDDVRRAVAKIADTISADTPLVVVGVLLSIDDLVALAIENSTHPATPWQCLPFPHPKNTSGQRRYQEGLGRIIRDYDCG